MMNDVANWIEDDNNKPSKSLNKGTMYITRCLTTKIKELSKK